MQTKTVFISGGSRGIGEAVVRACAGKYNVAFTYNSGKDRAQKICEELACFGGVEAYECDVTSVQSVKQAVAKAKQRFGRIDILINNAGIAKSGLFIDLPDEEWQRLFDVNVNGVRNLTREVLVDMLSQRWGSIVNIASIFGESGGAMESAYSATKGAVIALTKALAKEVAPSMVRVNCVAPGAVDTNMMACYSKQEKDALCEQIPLGRLATPEDVASVVMAVAEAQYMTGAVVDVNGGW